jgi:hypothetical protein
MRPPLEQLPERYRSAQGDRASGGVGACYHHLNGGIRMTEVATAKLADDALEQAKAFREMDGRVRILASDLAVIIERVATALLRVEQARSHLCMRDELLERACGDLRLALSKSTSADITAF